MYGSATDDLLSEIVIPYDAVLCNDRLCKSHHQEISDFHDDIITKLIQACNATIPSTKSGSSSCRITPGWNDFVKPHFNTSLFWHDMWVQNGRPRHGVIADLRHKTRAQYHRACLMVLRKEAEIRCDKMAEAILSKSTNNMWKQAITFRKRKTFYPNTVDGAQGDSYITDSC